MPISTRDEKLNWEDEPMNDGGSDKTLDTIFKNKDSLIAALNALVQDLHQLQTRNQLHAVIRDLKEAQSPNAIRSNKQLMHWLPVLASGFSDEAIKHSLTDLIDYASRDHELRLERKRALAYPAVLVVGIGFVLGLLTILVVPIFDRMFDDYGIQLPGATQMLISLSREVREQPLYLLLKIAILVAIAIVAKKLWSRLGITHRLFKFLINGNSASVSEMSILTGRLAELLHLGLSRNEALSLAGKGLKSHWYRCACEALAIRMAIDMNWAESKAAKMFPNNMILALQGNATPNIDLLRELSAMYAERIHHRVDWATGAFAQIAIVCLGVAVGFVVIVLLTPLFSLISALS